MLNQSDAAQVLANLLEDMQAAIDRAVEDIRGREVGEDPPLVMVGSGELDHIAVDEAEFERWKFDNRAEGDDNALRLIFQLQQQAKAGRDDADV